MPHFRPVGQDLATAAIRKTLISKTMERVSASESLGLMHLSHLHARGKTHADLPPARMLLATTETRSYSCRTQPFGDLAILLVRCNFGISPSLSQDSAIKGE
ncbi:MAG: hypothetical protein GY880_05270 [Planctomycetaceae bacterium]|nr:hypothetical protein [Planctomycetaceae bacterium]